MDLELEMDGSRVDFRFYHPGVLARDEVAALGTGDDPELGPLRNRNIIHLQFEFVC